MAQQLPRTVQPPPNLPDLGAGQNTLANYLRSFSLWCRHGFADKLSQTTATPSVMLQTDDVPPAVYQLKVTSGPTLTLAPMTLGSGDVGDPVPVGSTQSHLDINATPSTEVTVSYSQDGVMRWYTGVNTASNWFLARCDDAGEYVGSTLTADRASGVVSTETDFYCYGGLYVQNFSTLNGGFSVPAISYSTIYNAGGWIGQATRCNFMVQSAGPGNSAMMTFHCAGEFACQFGLHGDSHFHIGGWSFGSGVWYQVWTQADFANPACDYRIKDAVEPLDSTWETVRALKPIRYRQKEFALPIAEKYPVVGADERERWGFIAHELQETLGDTAAHCPKDDPDRLQAPNMMMLVAALTKTVQELQARVEQLEAR
jgi:Chaperone of endosialidase